MYRIPKHEVILVRDGSIYSSWAEYRNSREVFDFAKEHLYKHTDREQFYVLLMNSKNRVIGLNLVSVGSINMSIVHPREVFKPAILANATAVICLHNHPSGDSAPSREDIDCTQRLVEAGKILGIRILDHVICGEEDYFSFIDTGKLQ